MARSAANPDTIEGRLYLPTGDVRPVNYDPSTADRRYMDAALEQAQIGLEQGNSPVGAVLVTPTGTFADHSREAATQDLRSHAEINVYEQAQPEYGLDLSRSTLYTTLSPCGMCFSLLSQGHIGAIYVAAEYGDVPDFVRPRDYDFDKMLRSAGRTIMVVTGLRKEKAIKLMQPGNKRHKSAGQN